MEAYGYRNILNKKLAEKRKVNPSYSLRAFSRDLNVAPQVLSLVLSDKRKLPEKYADSMIEKLELNYREELLFRQDIANERGNLGKLKKVIPNTQNIVHEEINYKLITDWEYYAVYTLLETEKPFSSSREIAKERIDVLPSEKKQFSSATLPIKEENIDDVRKMMQGFQNKLSKYVRTDQADSVYQLNIQFFSLTH